MRFIRAAILGVFFGSLILCLIVLLTVGIENANKVRDRHITAEEYEVFVETGVLPSEQR